MPLSDSSPKPIKQYINEAGECVQTLPEFSQDPLILKHLYEIMVLTRSFDKKAIALQRTGKLGTYPPINGQEAISTAIGHALRPEDVFIPYYRDYAAQVQRGVKFSEILAYWGGDERGNHFVNCKEDLPICVPIASQCLHAAGVAFAFKYRNEARVALVTIGEGGTSEGDFYEALNVAGAWKLPLVFVINNNQWAISVPLSKQTAAETLAQKAAAAGFEGLRVDGNDVLACRQVIAEAIEKARQGQGPVLIEALTYRLCNHTTADDCTRYQPPEEVKAAQLKEPISRFKRYLEKQGLWDEQQEATLIKTCAESVQKTVEEYLQTPAPSMSMAFDFHYEKLPPYLIEQRAIALEETSHG